MDLRPGAWRDVMTTGPKTPSGIVGELRFGMNSAGQFNLFLYAPCSR